MMIPLVLPSPPLLLPVMMRMMMMDPLGHGVMVSAFALMSSERQGGPTVVGAAAAAAAAAVLVVDCYLIIAIAGCDSGEDSSFELCLIVQKISPSILSCRCLAVSKAK